MNSANKNFKDLQALENETEVKATTSKFPKRRVVPRRSNESNSYSDNSNKHLTNVTPAELFSDDYETEDFVEIKKSIPIDDDSIFSTDPETGDLVVNEFPISNDFVIQEVNARTDGIYLGKLITFKKLDSGKILLTFEYDYNGSTCTANAISANIAENNNFLHRLVTQYRKSTNQYSFEVKMSQLGSKKFWITVVSNKKSNTITYYNVIDVHYDKTPYNQLCINNNYYFI